MVSLHTGSDRLLEIVTDEVNIVIKAKKAWNGDVSDMSSSIVVEGFDIHTINIEAIGDRIDSFPGNFSRIERILPPLFFEQTDYEMVIRSKNQQRVSLWNENYSIRDKIGAVIDGDETLISGIINFDNMVGFSDFDIYVEGTKKLRFRIEVFPTKISYKEDYQAMIADISDMVCNAALDFMQKTYQLFSLGDSHNSIIAIYFQVLRSIFADYMNAANRVIATPHHRLMTEHVVVAQHKAKRTDRRTEKWLINHQNYMSYSDGNIVAERVLTAQKQITYDTVENQFVKFILISTINKLEEFAKRYIKSYQNVDPLIVSEAEDMVRKIRRVVNGSFLNGVSEYTATKSMSLVFGMAPGYRELYKCYIALQKSLSVNGDVFRMSPKDTAQLYEYWCFIKLFGLLKKEYKLLTPDIIKVDNTGITVSLVRGKKSEARFINPITEELITLSYNPGESETQTVNQRPDNVLELEKRGSETTYKYIFDAKYRIEKNPESAFYPDSNPGPKVDDINTMHRYRDSIVYENPKSKFTFEKTMFGAYILFPYGDEEKYKNHRFYKSIDTVNIGGLPFLPGSTKLVQKLLSELINDSKESAFERTTLPRGIEEKLATVDWNKRDVLIGTFRSVEQFNVCFNNRFYYVPEKQIKRERLPIHYVALYQTNRMFGEGEVRYFGEVIGLSRVRRKNIKEVPLSRNNGDEIYYRITVKEWKDISEVNESRKAIKPKESGFIVDFTNMFLLEHSEIVPELQFKSEEEYRFYQELKRTADSANISENEKNLGFGHGESKFVFSDGEILAVKNGKIYERIQVSEFGKRPAQSFRLLMYANDTK